MTPFQAPDAAVRPARDEAPAQGRPWRTVVWNDPVNLMSYVTYVFRSYFGMGEETARSHMLRVHHEGHAVVSHGSREKMEVDVYALQSYGLWATLEPGEADR